MFEGILSNIKNHSAKVSESINFETIRAQTIRLSENFDSFKAHTSQITSTLASTLKNNIQWQIPDKNLSGNQEQIASRENSHDNKNEHKCELRWPVLVDNKVQWVPSVVKTEEDDEDIVDKFIRVISCEEDVETYRKRRNDREEIRRRLAMGPDADEYYGGERPGRKPSLQARLQSGMNLQICFMNETVSDTESPSSDTEPSPSPVKCDVEKTTVPQCHSLPSVKQACLPPLPLHREPAPQQPLTEADFFAWQARLQAEARLALAQAKEMAHMQMEVERQRQKKSPITEMVRCSLEKVGIPFPDDRRRVSRQLLTEMNVAQLQVIVNDLHTQIEVLNENLVKFLMDRDDLHMEQDSMLVDIEDLTRYFGAKEQTAKEPRETHMPTHNNNHHPLLSLTKPRINRIASLVKK